MKKNNLFKQLGALSAMVGLGGSVLLSGCGEENKEEPPKATVTFINPVKAPVSDVPQKVDATYEAFRKSFEGFSYTPRAGFYQGNPHVLIGFGTPISQEAFVKLTSSFDGLGRKDVDTQKREVFACVLSGQYLPEKYQNFRIENDAIRNYSKQFILSLEDIKLRPLCEQRGFSYDALDPRVKAVMINIDLGTGGKVETYDNFLTAVGRENWTVAQAHCGVLEKLYKKTHPQAPLDAGRLLNEANRRLINQVHQESMMQKAQILQQKHTR